MTRPFVDRHVGPAPSDADVMLRLLGVEDTESLLAAALPAGVASDHVLDLPEAASEPAVLAELRALADRNQLVRPLIGTGYSPAYTPSVLLRGVLENPAWYTAYTPYQPEISQGRLEALLTYQTMVADLTALDVANASLLDEGTAAAEAMAFARRVVRGPGLDVRHRRRLPPADDRRRGYDAGRGCRGQGGRGRPGETPSSTWRACSASSRSTPARPARSPTSPRSRPRSTRRVRSSSLPPTCSR